jgi:hypothetical protein
MHLVLEIDSALRLPEPSDNGEQQNGGGAGLQKITSTSITTTGT